MCKCDTKEVIGGCLNWRVPKPVLGITGSHSHDVLSVLMQLFVEKCPKLDGSFSKKKKGQKKKSTLNLHISNNPNRNKRAPCWKQHRITGLVEKHWWSLFLYRWLTDNLDIIATVYVDKSKKLLTLDSIQRGCFSSSLVGYPEPCTTAYPNWTCVTPVW